jgi:hypothetical protein
MRKVAEVTTLNVTQCLVMYAISGKAQRPPTQVIQAIPFIEVLALGPTISITKFMLFCNQILYNSN